MRISALPGPWLGVLKETIVDANCLSRLNLSTEDTIEHFSIYIPFFPTIIL